MSAAALLLPVMLLVIGTFLLLPGVVLAWLAVRKPRGEPAGVRRTGILTGRLVLLVGCCCS